MRFQLLPSSFDDDGRASRRQHLACFIVDDSVALDAGSLAMGTNSIQKKGVRDVVLTHAHLDHIAGLPLFIDDLFASVKRTIKVHATREVIEILERDIFNWSIYPRFSELRNENGVVMEYVPFEPEMDFQVKHLQIKAIGVNHKVPAVGFIVSDGRSRIAMSSDTAAMERFWEVVNEQADLSAVLVECAFPDELAALAELSHHLTPSGLRREISKLKKADCPVYVINIKPMYYEQVVLEICQLGIENLQVLEVGKVYEW